MNVHNLRPNHIVKRMRWAVPIVFLAVIGLVTVCGRSAELERPAAAVVAASPVEELGRLHPGDAIVMSIFASQSDRKPAVIVLDVVGDEGTVVLLSNRVFCAEGKKLRELEEELRPDYAREFPSNAIVRLSISSPPWYRVRGEVRSQGRWRWDRSATVMGAILRAGGFTKSANQRKVRLRRGDLSCVIDCVKAQNDPRLDMPLAGIDEIVVPRSFWK